jgi:hypothetical protein
MSYPVLPNSPCIGLITLEPRRSQSVMKQNGARVAHIVRERHQPEISCSGSFHVSVRKWRGHSHSWHSSSSISSVNFTIVPMEGIQTSLTSPLFLFSFFLSQNLSLSFSRISQVLRCVNFALDERLFHAHFNKYWIKNWNMKLARNSFFSDITPVVHWVSIHKFLSEIMTLKWKDFILRALFLFLMKCVFLWYYLVIFCVGRRRNCKTLFHYAKLVAGMRDSRVTFLRRNHVQQS